MHISAGSALPRCTGPSWVVAVKFWQLGHSSPEWSPQSTVLVQDTHVSRFCRLPQTAHASAARTGTAAFGAAHDGNTTGDVSLLVSSQWERFQGDWRALCRIKKMAAQVLTWAQRPERTTPSSAQRNGGMTRLFQVVVRLASPPNEERVAVAGSAHSPRPPPATPVDGARVEDQSIPYFNGILEHKIREEKIGGN